MIDLLPVLVCGRGVRGFLVEEVGVMRFVAVQAEGDGSSLASVAGGARNVAALRLATPAVLGVVQLVRVMIVVPPAGLDTIGVSLILPFQDFYYGWSLSVKCIFDGLAGPQLQIIGDIVQDSLREHLLKIKPVFFAFFSFHHSPHSSLHKFISL